MCNQRGLTDEGNSFFEKGYRENFCNHRQHRHAFRQLLYMDHKFSGQQIMVYRKNKGFVSVD